MTAAYVIFAKIVTIEERHEVTKTEREKTSEGEKIMETSHSLGWFVTLDLGGQRFSFAVGDEKPEPPILIKIKATGDSR